MEEQEYETQFFGFNPKAFTDAVYNVKYDYVHNAIRVLHDFLAAKFPNVDRQVLMKGSEQLRAEILKSAEKICDKLEVYLSRNILAIPGHVTLPEDAVHLDEVVIGTDETHLEDELLRLHSQIRSVESDLRHYASEKIKLQSAIDSYESTLMLVRKMNLMLPDDDVEEAMGKMVTMSASLVESVQNNYELTQQLPKTLPLLLLETLNNRKFE